MKASIGESIGVFCVALTLSTLFATVLFLSNKSASDGIGYHNETGETTMSESAPSLRTIMEAPLKATGADIPAASYGATLLGYGDPFMIAVAEKFKKPGQPEKRAVFEANFAIFVKDQITEISYLIPVPDGGATNRKSNLFKMLRALGGSDPKLFNAEGEVFASPNVKLVDFVGKTCVLSVKKSDKDFPQVESVGKPMDGVKYPSLEDARKALSISSEGIPF